MPHTQFDMAEAGEYLHLTPQVMKDLVKCKEIPFHHRGGDVVFIREEVDSWASQRILGFKKKSLTEYHKHSSTKTHSVSEKHALIPELMKASYIEPSLSCRTRASVMKNLPALADRTGLVIYPDELTRSILERETLGTTAMPGGFALLHPRNHDPYMFEDSFIALGRSSSSLPFGAPDGFKTDLFFVICCQNDRLHLHVLARLSMMCNYTELLIQLREAADAEEMFSVLCDAEDEVIRYL